MRVRLILTIFMFMSTHAIAVPEVDIASDPLISMRCTSDPEGKLTISGATVSTVGAHLYQTGFNPLAWSGSLKKLPLKQTGGSNAGAPSGEWDAADILNGNGLVPARPDADARHIYTARINADLSLSMIPFSWANLSTAQRAALNTSPSNGVHDDLGEKRLDYLRGGRRYEIGQAESIFRARDRVLGAIVHSAPVFVGVPSSNAQGADYREFHEANRARRPAVYAGAGDGMLHAFDATTGEELFAYIPHVLFERLGQLTSPNTAYVPYVDGAITVAEARVGKQWRSVLLSGMGGGAQGVFALDVTVPDKFEQGTGVLWEFTDADDPDIGNVFGPASIAKFKVSVVKGVPTYRYFAVVTSGLNNYRDDGNGKFNASASSALFLLALDKTSSDKWTVGLNYFKFIVPISDQNLPNGLAAPAFTLAGDGAVDVVYAGDLQGNMWRFDFSGSAPWPNVFGGASPKPLFVAMDANKNRQAITQKANVVFAPERGYLVSFGTGKFMEASDLQENGFRKQSFYGILDNAGEKIDGRHQLAERRLVVTTASSDMLEISGDVFKYGSAGSGEKGWYFDFIDFDKTGERSISSAQIIDGRLFFNTLIPSNDPCKSASGRSYVLDVLTGLSAIANWAGYLSNMSVANIPVMVVATSNEVAERDATGKRRIKEKLEVIDPLTGKIKDVIAPTKENVLETVKTAGRLSWREIVNWVELRSSLNKK